jgi:ferrous iron transport protein B
LVDLPGVRSLVPRSPDEAITSEFLLAEAHVHALEGVVVVLDATQLRRGLFLLSQVLETGLPLLVCVNMADEARAEGVPVDVQGLSLALGGIDVFATSALSGEGVEELSARLNAGVLVAPARPQLPDLASVRTSLPPSRERWRTLRTGVDDSGLMQEEAAARWRFAADILQGVKTTSANKLRQRSDRVDRFALHAVWGPFIFVAVMALVFQAVFTLATPAADAIEAGVALLGDSIRTHLGASLVTDLLVDGALAGVGAVIVFLPQVMLLFLLLILLEDSGYLSRAAFIADKPFAHVGLSGRTFAPWLSSFACAVPGILGLRSIEDQRERRIAMFAAPLLTCSARLPVYTLLISAFVPRQEVLGFLSLQGLLLLALYLLGLALAILAAAIYDRVMRDGARLPLLLELPPYRLPALRTVGLRLIQRAGMFLRRAGTLILLFSVLVWGLTTFPRPDRAPTSAAERAAAIESSFAGRLGHWIEPTIEPLGQDWRIGIGIVASFAAREVFNSTLSVVYAVETREGEDEDARLATTLRDARHSRTGAVVFTLPTVLGLLAFYAVALQCVSTIAVVARESRSWRFALTQFLVFALAAWVLAWAVRSLALAVGC